MTDNHHDNNNDIFVPREQGNGSTKISIPDDYDDSKMVVPKDYADAYSTPNTSRPVSYIDDSEGAGLRDNAVGDDPEKKMKKVKYEFPDEKKKELDPKTRRKNRIRMILRFFTLIIFDLGLPLTLFFVLNTYSTPVIAAICAGIPPLLRIIYTMIRHKRFDFLNGFVIATFAISAIVSAISGDIRVILLREAVMNVIMASAFLGSLIPIKTRWFQFYPLIHLIGREVFEAFPEIVWTDANGEQHEMMYAKWMWQQYNLYRKCCRVLTVAWGCMFIADAASRVAMVFTGVDPVTIITVGMILSFSTLGVLILVTIIVFGWLRKRCIQFTEQWLNANDYSSDEDEDEDDTLIRKKDNNGNDTFSSVPIV
ncbi:hypothetical protein BDA99DRAFT_493056 [Phascolomyces articulosus]|uniref:Uncharacterized protein n=1 Tax=Phascolomyces articulosus TaxID=60185 RepID=A0AAD5KCQ6_9FUNG|nr:hypothetical protein BDA99DRAFT_493056 [Phascolomyces articulosus]